MSSRTSTIREIEHNLTSECKIEPIQVLHDPINDHEWDIQDDNTDDNDDGTSNPHLLRGASIQNGTTLLVSPMDRHFGGWDDSHFHPSLCVPADTVSKGVVVTFQSMSRECIAIALSPTPSFQLGKTYVVHFGANGNLTTVIRRRLPTGTECVDESFSTARICSDNKFLSYWIIFNGGKLYVGIGEVPGQYCFGFMDDCLYDQLRPGQDMVKYVGIGNSVLGKYGRHLKVRNVVVCGIPFTPPNANPILTVEESKPYSLLALNLRSADNDGNDNGDAEIIAEYEKECDKARARAKKFGITYTPPNIDAFLKWSEVRRLKANPEPGFITGIDVTSKEEEEKRKMRKDRFKDDNMETEEDANATNDDILPADQAWDKEDLVKEFRVDPPIKKSSLQKHLKEQNEEDEGDSADMEEELTLEHKKIHLFGIDWAAFKQIRSDDIMDYFSDYGPSYVEWLSELSCNILFEDQFSANRALHSLSQKISSPPPKPSLADLGAMGWRFCFKPVKKLDNDHYGRRGTISRVLLRYATPLDVLVDKPEGNTANPPGFTTKKRLGPGSDYPDRKFKEPADRQLKTPRKRQGGKDGRGGKRNKGE